MSKNSPNWNSSKDPSYRPRPTVARSSRQQSNTEPPRDSHQEDDPIAQKSQDNLVAQDCQVPSNQLSPKTRLQKNQLIKSSAETLISAVQSPSATQSNNSVPATTQESAETRAEKFASPEKSSSFF